MCVRLQFHLQAQLKVLRDRLDTSEKRIKEIQEHQPQPSNGDNNNKPADGGINTDAGGTFKLKMQSFAREAGDQLAKLDEELDKCKALFQRTVLFYKFSGRNNEKVERPAQFFELWTQFTADVEDIWKRHLVELKMEL